MADLNAFYQQGSLVSSAISAEQRAVNAWNRISQKSSIVTLYRNGEAITAQTLRIEFDDSQVGDRPSATSTVSQHFLVLFGVQDHPTVTDNDLADDDQFLYDGFQYEVKDVIKLPGEIQAKAVRRSK